MLGDGPGVGPGRYEVEQLHLPGWSARRSPVHPLLDDHDWPDLRVRADGVVTALMERSRADRMPRSDLSVSDIVFATIRFGRPLAIGLPPSEDRDIAHRQLDRYVDGLRSAPPGHDDPTEG